MAEATGSQPPHASLIQIVQGSRRAWLPDRTACQESSSVRSCKRTAVNSEASSATLRGELHHRYHCTSLHWRFRFGVK